MLKIFLSSTYRDLAEYRSKILEKLNAAFEGVGMEEFIPDGSNSQEICIGNLKKMKEGGIVIFLISPYYGSLMESCSLKTDCKADCPMKTGKGRISYTHCEYKTTLAEGILHQTYLIEQGWDDPEVKEEARTFKKEIEKGEFRFGIQDRKDPDLIPLICNNLATKIIEWHSDKKLDFTGFCDRSGELNDILNNIDETLEVYGVGGIGKTALIQIALLIQKLKGKRILTIGTSKAYASGSGYKYFRETCKGVQYISDSKNEITIYDIINALAGLFPDVDELRKKETDKIIDTISEFLGRKESPIVFIDDFHLANMDVQALVKNLDRVIICSRSNSGLAKKEICLKGIREEFREDFINIFINIIANYHDMTLPESVIKKIVQIAEGHPVSMIYLIKNYPIINFDKLAALKKKIYPEDFIDDPNIFLNYY